MNEYKNNQKATTNYVVPNELKEKKNNYQR